MIETIVANISGPSFTSGNIDFTDADNFLFFSIGDVLWTSDGTTNGTILLRNFNTDVSGGDFSPNPTRSLPVAIDGKVFFVAEEDQFGREVWFTDGTVTGTQVLEDINPVGSSFPDDLIDVNGNLFFTTKDTIFGDVYKLWKSDGTSNGTELIVENIRNDSPIFYTATKDNELFFIGAVGDGEFGLWKNDGTSNGTELLPNTSNIIDLPITVAGNNVFFFQRPEETSQNPVRTRQLWKTNGTAEGTQIVDDILNPLGFTPPQTVAVADTLFVAVDLLDEGVGTELWKTDGNGELELVKDIRPEERVAGAPVNEGSNPENLINIDGTLFFTADDGVNGRALWKSDGTTEGTQLVQVIQPDGRDVRIFSQFQEIGNELYFFAENFSFDVSLWKSDGTQAGTVRIDTGDVELQDNTSFADNINLTEFNEQAFFAGEALVEEDGSSRNRIGLYKVSENISNDSLLNDPINRFQNRNLPGTFLFATEGESQSIRDNFPNFDEEGRAFNVSLAPRPEADLVRFNRFQNSLVPGTYLYATEGESISIRDNFPNFNEEGIAFYAYGVDANQGTDIYRLQNTQQPGTYIFVNEAEKDQILANFPQFDLEGVAFEVGT